MADAIIPSWGRCTIKVKKVGATDYEAFPIPVKDSTKLETTEGETLELIQEGNRKVAKKTDASSYTLTTQFFVAPNVTLPIIDKDGVVADEYSVQVIPENAAALAIQIDRASCSVTKNFDAAGGITKTFTFEALVPTDETDLVKELVIA